MYHSSESEYRQNKGVPNPGNSFSISSILVGQREEQLQIMECWKATYKIEKLPILLSFLSHKEEFGLEKTKSRFSNHEQWLSEIG